MNATVKKHLFNIGILFFFLVLLGCIVTFVSLPSRDFRAQGGSNVVSVSTTPVVKVQTPMTTRGEWRSDNTNAQFVATITDDTIEIELRTNQGSLTYWRGSFHRPAYGVRMVQSIGDETTRYWSTETFKDFTVENGVISFQYAAMGTKATIVLRRV